MFYKMTDDELKLLEEIQKITITDYEIKDHFIEVEKLINVIQDLKNELDNIEEKMNDLENDVAENYRRIPTEEQVF